jgi:adenosylhomocysteine nucleosidase
VSSAETDKAELMAVAIIAALPREVLPLVWGAKADRTLKRRRISRFKLPDAVVVAAGMGPDRVTLAVEAALEAAEISMLVSAGLAGSCDPQLYARLVAEATEVVDVRTGERYATEAHEGVVVDPRYGSRQTLPAGLILATGSGIASVHEKARLRETYGAAMVDMEAATVARLARARGLRFRAIKGISDGPEFELEGLARFTGKHGEFLTASFAVHTALRPWTWRKAVELGQGSNLALGGLTQKLRQVIQDESLR